MTRSYLRMGPFLGLLLCTTSLPAVAQTTDASSSATNPNSGGLEEVVVTARRRAENLENVPSTVEALSAAALSERGIESESDLQSAVSGLVLRANNNSHQIDYVIRGEAQEPYSGSVPGVQPYVDDVALSGSYGAALYDLEDVQVLKGPQGTLFGRNTTGGAVLYQTALPDPELGGYASIQYGNFDRFVGEGALDVPISGDQVMLRLAGTYQSGGAFVRNLYDNQTLGDNGLKSFRVTFEVKPNDHITNTTMAQYSDFSGTSEGSAVFFTEPCGGTGANFACWANSSNAFFNKLVSSPTGTYFPGWPNGYVYPGGLPTLRGFLRSVGRYVVDDNGPQSYGSTDVTIVNTTTAELSSSVSIKNIFGFDRMFLIEGGDNDGTPYPFLQSGGNAPGGPGLEQRETNLLSDEVQLQGQALNNRLNFLLGAFYSSGFTQYNSPIAGGGYISSINYWYTFDLRYKERSQDSSYALFTQESYALTDRINVTAGLRTTWDRISLAQLPYSSLLNPAISSNHTTENLPSWTLSLDDKLASDLMAYATTRGSWRIGGYNPFVAPVTSNTQTAATGGNYFPPETVRDAEIGIKYEGSLGNVPFRVNADVFDSWYENMEKTGSGVVNGKITSTTISVPAAEVRGVEADFDLKPVEWLKLGGNYSYDFGQYTSNIGVLYGSTSVFGPFSDTPRYSGTLYAEVTQSLGSGMGALTYHVDGFAESSFHVTSLGNTFEPGDKLPGYVLLNARLDWSEPLGADGFTASVFVKNLTDAFYYTGGGGGIQSFGLNNGDFGLPRTYGFVLRYDF